MERAGAQTAHRVERTDVEIRPLTAALGAEVTGVDLSQVLPDDVMAELERALYEHLVLFFRDQDMTPDDQIRFGSWFGPFERHPFAKSHPDHPELTVLDQTTPRDDGGNSWHSDTSFMETPALGSVLRAVQLPPLGGDTCWASMYAAYDALSDPMRSFLGGLTALHDLIRPLTKAVAGRHSIGGVEEIRAQWPPVEHPVVRTHPVTNRKSLYVNSNFTTRICGLTEAESNALLPMLLQHVGEPEFQVRFRWTAGAVVLWDNRCTQHYAVPDYTGHRRVMHRVALSGDRPR
jgi:taurine dioxygenase